MDFISNLIKRPISLVLNESSNTMDKSATNISASLPNTPSVLELRKDSTNIEENSAKLNLNNNNNHKLKPSAKMSSSYNGGGHISDYIGVPEEFLDEFKDILPPPPLNLQNCDNLSQTLLDIDDENTRCMSVTPPPPPLPSETETSQIMTPSMKASRTIDELLSHINDNLQQAGLNDEVLAIASPSNKTELNPLANKAALNNSKLLTPSSTSSNVHQNSGKTPTITTAAGSAETMVFENNSSIHKFHIDPDFDEHQQQHVDLEQQHQHGAKDHLKNSDVHKSSNKFVGLTEFDEAKIPELPGDLNPNIEEQYTFEECFIPTLTAQQGTKVPDEYIVDKSHLLLPTETDAISSENEVYADCNDEKDPLGSTFAEPTSLDVTTDLESYQSAVNNTINSNLNNTMENIADITMEAEGQPLHKLNLTQNVAANVAQQCEAMDEDEPMDIDMNATMEIIQNTSSNIQHVEKVLQHAENILQHIEDKKPLEEMNSNENSVGSLEKQTEKSKATFVINSNVESSIKTEDQANYEMEQPKHELSLNKSIELPVNKLKTLSSECIIETIKKEEIPDQQEATKESTVNIHNLIIDCMNTSTSSNTSTKSEKKLNLTSNLSTSISSLNSQKSSVPSSPSFPIKNANNTGFPRSPKSVAARPKETPFLEKSDYLANYEKSESQENPVINLNGTFVESSSMSETKTNNLNGTFVEPQPIINENDKRRTFNANPTIDQLDEAATDLTNKRQTFSVDQEKAASEKRRTFSVKSNENTSSTQFPSNANLRRTFHVDDSDQMPPPESTLPDNSKNDMTSRLTFNMPTAELTPTSTEQLNMNTSFEPMDVDDTMSHNTTMPMPKEEENQQRSHSPQSPPLPAMQQRSQSPPLPTMQQRSQSPPLPTMQQRSQSPPLPAMQQRSQSPPLPTMQQRSQSPPLPTMQQRSQSPPLPTMQQRSQSPPIPTMQQRSQSPPLPTMQQRSQSPPLPTIQNNKSKLPPIATGFDATKIKEEQISPPSFESSSSSSYVSQPLPTLIQKRPPIRDARARAAEILSAKEQSNIKVKDEKDVFVEKFTPSPIEDIFTAVSATSTTLTNSSGFSEFDQTSSSSSTSIMNNGEQQSTTQQQQQQQQFDEEFSGNNNIIDFDFDYLLNKGSNNTPVDRSSLLLKFDPLLGVPVPVNQGQQQQLQQLQIPTTNTINPCLSPTIEEDEHNDSNRSFVIETGKPKANNTSSGLDVSAKLLKERSQEVKQQLQLEQQIQQQNKRQLTQGVNRNATMSVDVIKDMSLDNDCNKTFENSNSTQSDDKQINYKMDELEKKIKNEVLKTEDIEKKLKDAEQREEALIKRITEKDKTIAKMTGVIEAYEKAIAELIAEKEQLTQHYEKQLAEVKADRDSNYHHLTSLETTFSDLHVKYEKSKEMTCQLKESEEALLAEKRKNLENLHLQEQRYDKMKNHAMQQLEIANKKLESLTREHSIEITKLKALLKKEEIARSSINEQLAQKTKENAELVKICDELISGQGS
ncbi:transforming acidic coiled-coil protein isoform 2-T2 [Cochliomyia hominivorax]